MKVLVLGSNGFVGSNVAEALEQDHEVFRASRDPDTEENIYIDLLKPETIGAALTKLQPDAIIQCAGIVENGDAAAQNPVFTRNLLEQVIATGLHPKSIIVSGSAAEYGPVDQSDIPVHEDTPLNAVSPYGVSKVEETGIALKMRHEHDLPVVIARIFNPIGPGMGSKFLTTRIMQQVDEVKSGEKSAVEVSRLDSDRDYVNIRDVALGIKALIEHTPEHDVYNIGSGQATSNGKLVKLILDAMDLSSEINVVETSDQPEQLLAAQAAISRLKQEFDWAPSVTLEDTVKEIVDAAKQQ